MLDVDDSENHLSCGTELLHGQYKIERQIGQGGFGITYLARDSLNRQVVIKECFPQDICYRIGARVETGTGEQKTHFDAILAQFQAEALRLAALDHPGIVGVHQVFAENQTAYLAMELLDGTDLMTVAETETYRISPDILSDVLNNVLDAVHYMHDQGILHRDIAPDNLILGSDNHVTLIDFGAAYADCAEKGPEGVMIFAVKDGFSPYEFYVRDQAQTACSDLYSLGATFYFLITGNLPPDSQSRMDAISAGNPDPYVPLLHAQWDFDPRILETIDLALEVRPQDRVQSAKEWVSRLSGPMPAKKVMFDPGLNQAISELVKNTNKNLKRKKPGKLANAQGQSDDAEAALAKPRKAKQFVDIFGNPITDVEAFLREQDRLCKQKSQKTAAVQDLVSTPKRKERSRPEPLLLCDDREEPAVTMFGKVFARFKTGKRGSDPRLLHT